MLLFHRVWLTEVEHVRRRDEGHEVDSQGERQHANQDDRDVADGAAAEQHDAEETGEEDRGACCVPVTNLEKEELKVGQNHFHRTNEYTLNCMYIKSQSIHCK